jgi:hypothetical protein
MEQNKNKLRIITNYEDLLKEAISFYNSTYKTDFVLIEYVLDEVNFAIVECTNADLNHIFDFGRIYGGMSEAFDKKIGNGPRSVFL